MPFFREILKVNGWSLVLELILIFLVVKQTLGKKILKKKGGKYNRASSHKLFCRFMSVLQP